jgi:hypothetical protein
MNSTKQTISLIPENFTFQFSIICVTCTEKFFNKILLIGVFKIEAHGIDDGNNNLNCKKRIQKVIMKLEYIVLEDKLIFKYEKNV